MKLLSLIPIVGIPVIILALYFLYSTEIKIEEMAEHTPSTVQSLLRYGLSTDTSSTSIPLSRVLSGGPRKDGIPALTEPTFVSIDEANVDDETRGVLIAIGSEKRFYPYNILVWHEIVNDSISDVHFAVTFCPLCGSAITFSRDVAGEILTFGVSGLLYESNLLMYDTKTETLWSQALGEAVVGDYTGAKLSLIEMKLLEFGTLKELHPDAKVLSDETGHRRNYGTDPYTGYGLTDALYFPVSVHDDRYPAKEIFYVVPHKGRSIALQEKKLLETATFELDGKTLTAQRIQDGIEVTANSVVIPGYYEMWFSWATHHQGDGVVWPIE